MKIIEISKKEFDAMCYARNAHLMPLLDEIKYYKDEDQQELYGVIAKDRSDEDYGAILLGRDANKRFRAIELPERFYYTLEEALVELEKKFLKVHAEGNAVHPQGDEEGKPNELYKVVAKAERIHPLFSKLANDPAYSCAKAFIGEAVYAYVDVDGNYVKDFQSTGFNARLWELYLYIFLKHQGYEFDNSFQAPDYLIDKWGVTMALEATTVNMDAKFDEQFPENADQTFKLFRDYLPIKFGSSLFSKLQKKYWELNHVMKKPLIIAIHDFHMRELLHLSHLSIRSYLYGYQYQMIFENDMIKLVRDARGLPTPEEVTRHAYKHKDIPSNFFSQPDAEYVSAVLFCNNATLDTFERFGKLAKMGDYGRDIVRVAEINDLKSFDYTPKVVEESVDHEKYEESWGDTMCLFHNPNAKHPIHPKLFSGISQCYFDSEFKRFQGPRRVPEILRSFNKL